MNLTAAAAYSISGAITSSDMYITPQNAASVLAHCCTAAAGTISLILQVLAR
jgi:hypothetical protein